MDKPVFGQYFIQVHIKCLIAGIVEGCDFKDSVANFD